MEKVTISTQNAALGAPGAAPNPPGTQVGCARHRMRDKPGSCAWGSVSMSPQGFQSSDAGSSSCCASDGSRRAGSSAWKQLPTLMFLEKGRRGGDGTAAARRDGPGGSPALTASPRSDRRRNHAVISTTTGNRCETRQSKRDALRVLGTTERRRGSVVTSAPPVTSAAPVTSAPRGRLVFRSELI